ncbi:MAG: hydantoinase/oxoprolinase family protein [Alphaproteobacteria bacterium]|nr:hydantoinase/oxoprolinase family protein [Alphaproteobacteria bacterium]MCB9928835.1 hydantoinase/oxoprolinase family protein [Alphaproteobacteria bacterium]
MRVGVEIGGTFTDLVAFRDGGVQVAKVPSTPASPDIGAFDAIQAAGLSPADMADLGHGSTVATNAVLERKGARVAFVTTAGFRDILFLQRHDRRNIYDLHYRKPAPVVRRADCFEVAERVLADGAVETPLDEAAVTGRLLPALQQGRYDAVAICLLNAYANDAHERRVIELIHAALPDVFITGSADVIREFREFERASTTTLAAFVQPVIDRYLSRIEDRLAEGRFGGRFTVMQSNGGRLPAAGMRRNAITALFSGPAAGVVGAVRQAERSGYRNLITFDMGGTSTDVCLVDEGQPATTPETEIDGLPIRTPVLDIVSVGSGGGSIVWVDDGGLLRVGPESAGADPGPACYGKGGRRPTITDAQVIVGAVRPEGFLGGKMAIDVAAARTAFQPVADHFAMTIEQAADAAIRLANNAVVRAIQLVSTERGRDPRDYVLVPFGGGGPLHAAKIAQELGVGRLVVPPNPGVLSAYGLLASDFTKHDSLTRKMDAARAAADAPAVLAGLARGLADEFRTLGLEGEPTFAYSADMRCVGQAFELPVPLPATAAQGLSEAELREGFDRAHRQVYFQPADPRRAVEVVALRVAATLPAGDLPSLAIARDEARAAIAARLFDDGDWHEGSLQDIAAVAPGVRLAGPTILAGPTSTTYVPVGWQAELDAHDNLILSRER